MSISLHIDVVIGFLALDVAFLLASRWAFRKLAKLQEETRDLNIQLHAERVELEDAARALLKRLETATAANVVNWPEIPALKKALGDE